MANNLKRANAAVNEEASRIGTLANSGKLRIYAGTQPATADTAIDGGNILLAELTMNAAAFGSPTAGLMSAAAPRASAAAPSGRITVWTASQMGVKNGTLSAMNSAA